MDLVHDLDIGDGHYLDWYVAGDTRIGAIVYHPSEKAHSGVCAKSNWEKAHHDEMPDWQRNMPYWKLETQADEHITISPSVLCRSCGDHGFIRDGTWVRA